MVAVGAQRQIAVRLELGLPHGPGPRALQGSAIDLALLQNSQHGQEFVFRPRPAAAIIGQRRQGRDNVDIALDAAEIAFHLPDAPQDAGGHTIGLFDLARIEIGVEPRPCRVDTRRSDGGADIGAEWLGEFRLLRIGSRHAGQGLGAGQGVIDQVVAKAVGLGLKAKIGFPLVEAGIGDRRHRGVGRGSRRRRGRGRGGGS